MKVQAFGCIIESCAMSAFAVPNRGSGPSLFLDDTRKQSPGASRSPGELLPFKKLPRRYECPRWFDVKAQASSALGLIRSTVAAANLASVAPEAHPRFYVQNSGQSQI
jgi:hypothetical protein